MDFLKEIASSSPVPAGGAAVAYTTTLAIALIYKVVLFETGRGNEPAMEKNLITLLREIERLMKDVEKMVKEDAEVYTNFAQSKRTGDKTGMKHHFSKIIDVSIKVMEKSDAAFIWIGQLRVIVPKRMLTHLLVASELLMGAINGTVHVIRDNINAIKLPARRENYLEKVDGLHGDCVKRYSELMVKFN